MKPVELKENGAAYEYIYVAPFGGKTMRKFPFLLDPGATRTTINKSLLTKLGYTNDWILQNKILTSDSASKLSFLLGVDILSYFDVFFKYSEWRVYYEFRKDRTLVSQIKGDNFAYKTALGRRGACE
jgi:hypothetical protein